MDPSGQTRANSEAARGMRVMLPASAEPALQVAAAVPTEPQPQAQPAQNVQAPVIEKPVEKAEPNKAEKDMKAARQRYAERKAKRIAAARVRQRIEPQQTQVATSLVLASSGTKRLAGQPDYIGI